MRGTTVQLDVPGTEFLARRGARPHRGGGPFGQSMVLRRCLRTLASILDDANPYASERLPAALRPVIAASLPDPWDLSPYEVECLGHRLAQVPGFTDALAAAGLDPAATVAAVTALTLPEKWAAVDLAVQDQSAANSGSNSTPPAG
jgi:hypothetical protein